MLGRAFAIACALASSTAVAAPAPTSSGDPQQALDRGRVAYERGSYAEAVDTIYPLLYPSLELRTEESVVEAHRILALSYFFMTQKPEAEQEAYALLALRPNWEPDPIVDPPSAVAFFHAVRKKQHDRLKEIQERQRTEERRLREQEEKRRVEAKAKAERVYVERVVERHSRWVAFLPFGVGQFYNGHKASGAAFLAVELLMAGAWIGITVGIDQRYPHRLVPSNDLDTAYTLQALQISAGVAFWAVVAAGIIEAQVRFVPERVRGVRELQGPPQAPEKKPEPQKAPKMSLLPILSPGLYGLGVGGTF